MNDLEQRVADSRKNVIKNDRRARIAKGFFMVAVVGALAALLIITASTLDRVQSQVAQQQEVLQQIKTLSENQKTSTDDLKKNTADQLDKQTRYIECIAKFFASSDRNAQVIEDINKCVITSAAVSSDSASETLQHAPTAESAPLAVSPVQSSSLPSTGPQPSQPASPQPQPSLIQQVLNGIGGILRL